MMKMVESLLTKFKNLFKSEPMKEVRCVWDLENEG